MLSREISQIALSHLSEIGFSSEDKPTSYKYAFSLKNSICTSQISKDVEVISSQHIEITLKSADYNEAIYNDLHYGKKRIEEQCNNLNVLVENQTQEAWVLVTAYYACFFCVSEISKVFGKYTINFNKEELESILSFRSDRNNSLQLNVESNNSYFARVSAGEFEGEVKISLTRTAGKPHSIAWSNFSQVLNKVSLADKRITQLNLLKKIVSASEENGWQTPSQIRNLWNYSNANYYGEKGKELASVFSSIIKEERSTFQWAGKITLKPTEQNIPASMAFVYYILHRTHSFILHRLNI